MIGSGATAITLIPALTARGASVTMLPATPTWIFPAPKVNPVAAVLRKVLPEEKAYAAVRKLNSWRTEKAYTVSRQNPEKLKKFINKSIDKYAGDDFPLDRDPHFNPPYDPWDQRLCLSPDGDFSRRSTTVTPPSSPTTSITSTRPASCSRAANDSTPT